MIISLIGYMGCGKSHISKILGKKINFNVIDLDKEITKELGIEISQIFRQLGEIKFRKIERQILEKLLSLEDHFILSLGGGTPVYYDNMDLINTKTESIYLQASVNTLVKRLTLAKHKRPLIAHLEEEQLPEFIAKHLFERNLFYNKAKCIINTNEKSDNVITEEIISILNLH